MVTVEEEYELIELWQLTGRSPEQIVALYMATIETRRQLYVKEAIKDTAATSTVIDMFVLSYLDALTYFLELNHYSSQAEVVLKQRLLILERLSDGQMPEDRRQRMLSAVQIKLAYLSADRGDLTHAQALMERVLHYRTQSVPPPLSLTLPHSLSPLLPLC
ncbi:hypothetical protein ACOMHN_063478 [Nucella lapillus]